jgi:nitric oxide reductase subunit C
MASDQYKIVTAVILLTAFLGYSFMLYSSIPLQPVTMSDEAARGKVLWQQHNCTACHQVYGLGGFLGPDLTNEYSLRGPAQIRAFLTVGTATMPVYQMPEEDISALTAYLKHIDSTGIADPRTYSINYDGTIEQK